MRQSLLFAALLTGLSIGQAHVVWAADCCALECRAGFAMPTCTTQTPTCPGQQWTCQTGPSKGEARCEFAWKDPCCTGPDKPTCTDGSDPVCTGTACSDGGKDKCNNGTWECPECKGYDNTPKCQSQTCPGTVCPKNPNRCDQAWTGTCSYTPPTGAFYYSTTTATHNTYGPADFTTSTVVAVSRPPTVTAETVNTRACRHGIAGTVGRTATTDDHGYACRRGKQTTYPKVEPTCDPDVVHCAAATATAGYPSGPIATTAAQRQGTGTVTQTATVGTKRAGAAKVEIWVDDKRTVEYDPPPP